MKLRIHYSAPTIEVNRVLLNKGFATSGSRGYDLPLSPLDPWDEI